MNSPSAVPTPAILVIQELRDDLPFILLAEDGEDDVFFMKHAFRKHGLMERHFVAADGGKAVDYLSGTGVYSDRKQYPLPTLLLLDLKMPGLDGFGVLRWIRERPEFKKLAIVVVSGSCAEADVKLARELGANDCRSKPSCLPDLVTMVLELCQRWSPPNSAAETPAVVVVE